MNNGHPYENAHTVITVTRLSITGICASRQVGHVCHYRASDMWDVCASGEVIASAARDTAVESGALSQRVYCPSLGAVVQSEL